MKICMWWIRYFRHIVWFSIMGWLFSLGENGKKIKSLKNSRLGKRCFVVATGPSLTVEDLEKLGGEDTFGVNGIFLVYNQTKWRPTYYVCTDAPYFKKLVDAYSLTLDVLGEKEVFLNRETKKLNPSFQGSMVRWISFSPWNRIYNFQHYHFQADMEKGMYAFGTVTNIVMAIAMYMGYKEIILIGADCSNLNQHIVCDITDSGKDEEYSKKVIEIQLAGYKIMGEECNRRGVKVYNATRGGALEVFPRKTLEDFFV